MSAGLHLLSGKSKLATMYQRQNHAWGEPVEEVSCLRQILKNLMGTIWLYHAVNDRYHFLHNESLLIKEEYSLEDNQVQSNDTFDTMTNTRVFKFHNFFFFLMLVNSLYSLKIV